MRLTIWNDQASSERFSVFGPSKLFSGGIIFEIAANPDEKTSLNGGMTPHEAKSAPRTGTTANLSSQRVDSNENVIAWGVNVIVAARQVNGARGAGR